MGKVKGNGDGGPLEDVQEAVSVGDRNDAPAEIRSFKDLRVWQASLDLAARVYRLTRDFPPDERFGLVQQMRRAAVSVMSNIAEGYGRGARADYVRFLKMARGSAAELEAQLMLAETLSFVEHDASVQVAQCLASVQRLLAALLKSLATE